MLLTAFVAITVCWWVDRTQLKAELEKKDHTRIIAYRQIWESTTGVAPLYITHHAEEQKIRELIRRSSAGLPRASDTAIEILAVCKSYNQFSDKELPNAFVRYAMDANQWNNVEDVLSHMRNQSEFVENTDIAEAAIVIDNAMRTR